MKTKILITKKDVAFTIICIIFLLVNIAAVGHRGHRHAKQILCLSNLQKWGQFFHAYAADNDGFFMEGWTGECQQTAPLYKHYWMEALRPYYGNVHKLRCCPEATIPGTEIGGGEYGAYGTFIAWGKFSGECGQPSTAWPWVIACDYGSYGNNAYICNPPPCESLDFLFSNNWRTANVPAANTVPMLGDGQWLDTWPHHADEPPAYDGEFITSQMSRVCMNRHEGYVCWVFLDGHARPVGLKELWKLKWHRTFDPNGGPTPDEWPEWMQEFPEY